MRKELPLLLNQALEIYDNQPPTYRVGTSWQEGQPVEWTEFETGPGEAAYSALEAAGESITIRSISFLRSALERELAKRVNSVDPPV